jgi:hypothetical protein
MGEKTNADRVWWGNPRERERQEDLGTDGRIRVKE